MAVNCFVVPLAMLGLAGEMEMDARVAAVTVRVVVPEMLPSVAVAVAEPTPTPFASPELEIVALNVSDEDHVTDAVRSAVVLSE